MFLILTLWVREHPGEARWLTAWAVLAGCLVLFNPGLPWPRYWVWPLMISLVRWNRQHLIMSSLYLAIGMMLTLDYTHAIGP
jgi:hypothetical protein